jgi:tryptophan halogenase
MMPYDELRQSLADLRRAIADTVAKLPSHPDFLRSYCPAEAP